MKSCDKIQKIIILLSFVLFISSVPTSGIAATAHSGRSALKSITISRLSKRLLKAYTFYRVRVGEKPRVGDFMRPANQLPTQKSSTAHIAPALTTAATSATYSPVQTSDITLATYTTNPNGLPTSSTPTNVDPVYSHDESFLMFASTRSSDKNLHLYSISYTDDPTTMVQMTSGTLNERWPSLLGPGDNQVAYCQSASARGPFRLMVAPLENVNGELVVNQAQALAVSPATLDVQHPSYHGDTIVYAARPANSTKPYHLYYVEVSEVGSVGINGATTELTYGNADEENPTFLGTNALIAFDSNATTYSTGGAGSTTSKGVKATRDIWVTSQSANQLEQVTNSPGTNNIDPDWSSADKNAYLNPDGAQTYLYFSSNRIGQHYSIFYLQANPDTIGLGTVLEATEGQQVIYGGTNTAVQVPTSDPHNLYDDVEPAESGQNPYLDCAFVSDRYLVNHPNDNPDPGSPADIEPTSSVTVPVSSEELMSARVLDIDPPSLLRYSSSEIVHVETTNQTGVTKRFVPPGSQVRFTVRVSDRQTGISNVYLEIKDPNSAEQDNAGLEHKVFTIDNTLSLKQDEDNEASTIGEMGISPYDQAGNVAGAGIDVGNPDSIYLNYAASVVAATTQAGTGTLKYQQNTTFTSNPQQAGFFVGESITVGDGVFAEYTIITAVNPATNTLTVQPALQIVHPTGSSIKPGSLVTANATATNQITVANGIDFSPGQSLLIGGGAQTVGATITAVNANVLTLNAPVTVVASGVEAPDFVYLGSTLASTIYPGTSETVSVGNAASFVANSYVDIDSGAKLESVLVTAVSVVNNTITIAKVGLSHGAGAPVVVGTLTAGATSGTGQPGVIQVANAAGFGVGENLVIDAGQFAEATIITNVDYVNNLIYVKAINYSHQAGAVVMASGVATGLSAAAPGVYPYDETVLSTAGFFAGTTAITDVSSNQEANLVNFIAPYTLELETPLQLSHAVNAPVVQETPTTALKNANKAGDVALTVNNAGFFDIGDEIQVGAGADQEYASITAINYQTNVITIQVASFQVPGLVNAHLQGEPVFPIIRNQFDPMGAETDCQAINASIEAPDASNPKNFSTPDYVPGFEDAVPYTGGPNGAYPAEKVWLKLTPLPAAQQDDNGGTLCTATWSTPSISSDYYTDVIAYDNAVFPVPYNTTELGLAAAQYGDSINWLIYDNVWGFSTQPFVSQHSVLVVNDYALPQKFFDNKFAGYVSGNNVPSTWYGAESYVTEIDANSSDTTAPSRLPTYAEEVNFNTGAATNYLPIQTSAEGYNYPAYANGLGYDSYIDDEQGDFSTVSTNMTPSSQGYDIWRVLSRGPVPSGVLTAYTPRTITQPANPGVANSTPTQVSSAPACVLWISPFAGDTFTDSGTITDVNTQTMLDTFLTAGGRLMVEGIDVGWALTNNGAVTNNFYTNDLQAVFGADDVGYDPGTMVLQAAGAQTDYISHDAYINQGVGGDPFDNGGVGHHGFTQWVTEGYVPGYGFNYDTPNNNKTTIANDGFNNDLNDLRTDGSLNASDSGLGFIDGFSVNPKAVPVPPFELNGTPVGTYEDGLIYYQNPTTGSKMVYSSFGLEALSQELYYLAPAKEGNYQYAPFFVSYNQRTDYLHDVICYLRTGTIQGTVHSVSGAGAGVAGTVVSATNGIDKITYTGISGANGSFQIQGLPAGRYALNAYKAGFSYQHQGESAEDLHGGDVVQNASLIVSPTAPGNVTITVEDSNTAAVLAGASVTLTEVASGTVLGPVLTSTLGTATFYSVPTGNYNVIANGTAIGYAVSAPTLLAVANTANNALTILLKKTGASISGYVTLSDPGQPDNGSPINGATVTLGTNPVTTVTTSPTGAYLLPNLQPGTYNLQASKATYGSSALIKVVVTAGASLVEPLQLTPSGKGGAYFQFASGLQMISVPYDYTSSAYTLSQILGSPTTAPKLAAFNPTLGEYVVTPSVPSDTFHLGQGYWSDFPKVTSLTRLGTQNTSTTFSIQLNTQWNMVGDPYPTNVLLSNLKVQDQNGNQYTFAAASGATVHLVGAQIYSYDQATNSYVGHYIGNPSEPAPVLSPYVGYWFQVYAPLTIIVPNPNNGG